MKNLFISLSVVLASLSANAELLKLQGELKNIDGVTVAAGATAVVDGKEVPLTTVASGMRKKFVIGPIGTSVYVLQLMANKPEAYVKSNAGTEALDSLDQSTVMAAYLEFVYNPSADQVTNAFIDALKANGVDIASGDVAQFLASVKAGGNMQAGDTMTMLISKTATGETLSYETAAGVAPVVNGAPGLGKKVMSMWLGKIAASDKGLKELKNELTK